MPLDSNKQPVWITCVGQIDMFKNYLYSIELYEKKKSQQTNKNVIIDIQWKWLVNFKA